MKFFNILLALFLVASLASCTSEDQKVVNTLSEGVWDVTSVKENGSAQPDSTFAGETYEFDECKVKNGACNGTYTYNDPTKGPTESSFTYSISDEGETITINQSVLGISVSQVGDIVESTDSRFTWSYTDEFGDVTETTIEKR